MNITFNNKTIDLNNKTINELKVLKENVQASATDRTKAMTTKYVNAINERIVEMITTGEVSVRDIQKLKLASKQTQEGEMFHFFPGLQFDCYAVRNEKFVLQYNKLPRGTSPRGAKQAGEWSFGSFVYTHGMLTITGKMSKSVVKISIDNDTKEAILRPSFDRSSADMINLYALRTWKSNGEDFGSSRHTHNYFFQKVGRMFNELYPTIIDQGTGRLNGIIEPIVAEIKDRELLFPEGEIKLQALIVQQRQVAVVQGAGEEAKAESRAMLAQGIAGELE